MDGFLFQAFIYLCAAVIAVPIAKRLGLGSVLGYLIAGIVIGPLTGLVGSNAEAMQELQNFAEFGVVMMLFLVGLELEPHMLWEMRNRLLGLGGLQVSITTALITGAALLLGLYWSVALAIGLILSLSSTAIVLQTLNEKGLTKTDGGRASFSILLFQDMAVIPILALIPLLALPELTNEAAAHTQTQGEHLSLVTGLPGWAHALVVINAVAAILLCGHFLARPLFRFIATTRLPEIFTASALLLVIGIALLMTLVGLSPALGTFLAGVVLADSEFRHELESNIEPFKGLLLGLFFITVGAGIDFKILFGDFTTILGLTLGVMLLKGAVLFGLARLFSLKLGDKWLFTLGLSQIGEFGFVLLNFSLGQYVLPPELAQTLSLVVALSMLLTPILFIFYDKFIPTRLQRQNNAEADAIDEQGSVIIAGSGRFGQIVNRLLISSGISTVVLDHEASTIDMLRQFGIKSHYGDASRPDLLHAAGIEQARALVIAIDDQKRTVEIVEYVKRRYPHIKIFARAFDIKHDYTLKKKGADVAVREVFSGSLQMGAEVLKALGMHPFDVEKMSHAFRRHDQAATEQLYGIWDQDPDIISNQLFITRAQEHSETLREILEVDLLQLHDCTERGWTPPPKDYAQKLVDQHPT